MAYSNSKRTDSDISCLSDPLDPDTQPERCSEPPPPGTPVPDTTSEQHRRPTSSYYPDTQHHTVIRDNRVTRTRILPSLSCDYSQSYIASGPYDSNNQLASDSPPSHEQCIPEATNPTQKTPNFDPKSLQDLTGRENSSYEVSVEAPGTQAPTKERWWKPKDPCSRCMFITAILLMICAVLLPVLVWQFVFVPRSKNKGGV